MKAFSEEQISVLLLYTLQTIHRMETVAQHSTAQHGTAGMVQHSTAGTAQHSAAHHGLANSGSKMPSFTGQIP